MSQSTGFFQLKASYLDEPWLEIFLQLWTGKLALTMWILLSVKTDVDGFFGPKKTPTIWILK